MKNKKIIFEQARKHVDGLLKSPKPASSTLPKWFKDEQRFTNGTTNLLDAFKKPNFNLTYKLCVPVTDSITAGYMLELPADIIVTNMDTTGNDYIPIIRWGVEFEIIDSNDTTGLGSYPIPFGYSNTFFRWIIDWKITTPDEYSLWVTHPSHRHDLPFFSLNGFVDTDKHPNALFLPFFIKKGFEGIIKEGTPIAQIIPVKRENWKSVEKKFKDQTDYNFINNIKLNFIRTYKNKYWTKKRYE